MEGMARRNYSFTTILSEPLFHRFLTSAMVVYLLNWLLCTIIVGIISSHLSTNFRTLWSIILDGFSHTYIVIDALDECIEQEKTLSWVNKIISDTGQKPRKLHVAIASRPLQNIQKIFRKLDPYCIDVAEATENKDIASYLNIQMKSKFLKYDEET